MGQFRYTLPLIVALLLPTSGSGQPAAQSCTPAVVDHVPIAVHSLDVAQSTFEHLGFRLKPGRVHGNGLRNAFVKFPGGDYLELISPEGGATDALTERYVALLEKGEGGSALALRTDSLSALGRRFAANHLQARSQAYGSAFTTLSFPGADLEWLFLIEYHSPVVDPPELLSHSNTATGIETVWLTEQAHATLSAIAGSLCLPPMQPVAEGTAGGAVAGVTLRVGSIDAVHRILRGAAPDLEIRAGARGRTMLLPAGRAHGLFIEFFEPDPGDGS